MILLNEIIGVIFYMEGFIKISKYAGMRQDLVQAGGGNTSVKLDSEMMLVKSSGFRLSDINENSGYTKVNYKMLKNELLKNQNNFANFDFDSLLNSVVVGDNTFKPSIETFLHALTKKWTLHTHSTIVNMIMCQKNYNEILKEVFYDLNYYIIPYVKPGVYLASEIMKLNNFADKNIQIIFMQNHGLIVSSDDYDEIINANEMILKKLEKYLDINYDKFHNVTHISKYFPNKYIHLVDKKIENIDDFIYEFCPDNIVYIGKKILKINNVEELKSIKNIENIKTIYLDGYIYVVANNYKKAKEIEEIIFNTIEILKYINMNNISKLNDDEILDILNRKDEKYRQNLGNI